MNSFGDDRAAAEAYERQILLEAGAMINVEPVPAEAAATRDESK
jgi:hypothetical protein